MMDEQQERAAFEAAAKGRMSLVRTWDDEGYDSPFTRGAYVGWKLARAAQVQRPATAEEPFASAFDKRGRELLAVKMRQRKRRTYGGMPVWTPVQLRLYAAARSTAAAPSSKRASRPSTWRTTALNGTPPPE